MDLDIKITEQDLPVLSAVATQALELLQDPNVSNRKIEELIRQDPSLTGRVLRTANSPFYAARQQSSTISSAIFRLGLRQLRNVIIVAATGELFDAKDPVIQAFWDHALDSALAAHHLAQHLRHPQAEEVFIGGMLHDVGKLIIYRQHPAVYGPMLEEARNTGRLIQTIEGERFRYFNHMSVGGLVIRKWKLSEGIAEAARFHHDLEEGIPRDLQCVEFDCLVASANVLVRPTDAIDDSAHWERIAALPCVSIFKIEPHALESIGREIAKQLATQHAGAAALAS